MKLSIKLILAFVALCVSFTGSDCDGDVPKQQISETLPYEGGNLKIDSKPVEQKTVENNQETNKELTPTSNPNKPILFKTIMPDTFDISASTGISALLFVSSLLVVFFIMYRACRMKQNRGERRYGGVTTSYQELAPITIEDDDSETEEQALFDMNKVRAAQVVL